MGLQELPAETAIEIVKQAPGAPPELLAMLVQFEVDKVRKVQREQELVAKPLRLGGFALRQGTTKQADDRMRFALQQKPPFACEPSTVPAFDQRAHGTPKHWNRQAIFHWGANARKHYSGEPGQVVAIDKMLYFLSLRLGPADKPVLERLHPPEARSQGCRRYRCGGFRESDQKTLLVQVLPIFPKCIYFQQF